MDVAKTIIDAIAAFLATDTGSQFIAAVVALVGAWVGKHHSRYMALYNAATEALMGKTPDEIAAGGFVTVQRAEELVNDAQDIKLALMKEGAQVRAKNIATHLALSALFNRVRNH